MARLRETCPTLFVIPSEARNLSFFSLDLPYGEIPRFARNDKNKTLYPRSVSGRYLLRRRKVAWIKSRFICPINSIGIFLGHTASHSP
jgi:hypothetical protein